jgi:hypothetical protein
VRTALVVVLLLGAAGRLAAAQAADPVESKPPADPVLEKAGEVPPKLPDKTAPSSCDLAEAADLYAHLDRESTRARNWNITWGVIFGGASLGSLGAAVSGKLPNLETGLYVSAGKAGIGALARLILPLRIPVPALTGDACTDVAALRKALEHAARRERGNFFLNHAGGIAVNTAGALIIWKYEGWGQALLSVALGYPIGLISNYTAPRASWHRYRERTWGAGVVPQQTGWLVVAGGSF